MPSPLLAGDILVTLGGAGPGHAGIALAEAGRGPALNRRANEDGQRPVATQIYEATSAAGIRSTNQWNEKSAVFRPANISVAMCQQLEQIASEIADSAKYGLGRVLFKSWTSPTYFSNNARDRLAKYRDRLQNHQGVVKNVYCSEFIVLVYQLACENEADPLFIPLNAKHTLPGTLGDWLKRNATIWSLVGTTDGLGNGLMDYVPGGTAP